MRSFQFAGRPCRFGYSITTWTPVAPDKALPKSEVIGETVPVRCVSLRVQNHSQWHDRDALQLTSQSIQSCLLALSVLTHKAIDQLSKLGSLSAYSFACCVGLMFLYLCVVHRLILSVPCPQLWGFHQGNDSFRLTMKTWEGNAKTPSLWTRGASGCNCSIGAYMQ